MPDWNALAFSAEGAAPKRDWDALAFGGDKADEKPSDVILRTPGGQQRKFGGLDTAREWRETEHAQGEKAGGVGSLATFSVPAESKMTAQGTASFLEEKLGKGSVYLDDQDRVFVLTPEERKKPMSEQRPVIFNRPVIQRNEQGRIGIDTAGITAADLALAPTAISGAAIGALAAPFVAPAGAALGGGLLAKGAGAAGVLGAAGAAGSLSRQGLAAALPGEEDLTLGQRAADVGLSGAAEVIAPGLAKVGGAAIRGGARLAAAPIKKAAEVIGLSGPDQSWAKGVLQTIVLKSNPKVSAEGVELAERTGIDFSAAQLSQGKVWLAVESFFKAQPVAGAPLHEAEKVSQQQLRDHGKRVVASLGAEETTFSDAADAAVRNYAKGLEDLAGEADRAVSALGTQGREEAATGAVKAYTAKLQGMWDQRDDVTNKLATEVTRLSRGQKILPVQKVINAIDALIEEYSVRTATSPEIETVKYLKNARAGLVDSKGKQVAATAEEFRKELTTWGRKARDPRNIIEKVTDPAINKNVAAKMYGAYVDSLDEAADTEISLHDLAKGTFSKAHKQALDRTTNTKRLAQAIRTLRTTYKEMSEPLRKLGENPIAQMVDSPERLVSILSAKDKSPVGRALMAGLDEFSPEHAGAVRAAFMRDVFAKVKTTNGAPDPLSMAKAIEDRITQISVAFEGAPEALAEIRALHKKALDLADNPLRDFIGRPEKLQDVFNSRTRTKELTEIMGYLQKAAPADADRLSGAFINTLIEQAVPGSTSGVEQVISPAALVRLGEKARSSVNIALGGNAKAMAGFEDMVQSARRLAAAGGQGTSPTQTRQMIVEMIKSTIAFAGAGAYAAFGLGQGDPEAAAKSFGSLGAYLLATRWASKAMANPAIAKAYAQAYRAAAQPQRLKVDAKFQKQAVQALSDIATWGARVQTQEQEEQPAQTGQSMVERFEQLQGAQPAQ